MVDETAVRARRSEILRAAEREFGERGYSGGRMERIARVAGVNKQLLFHYYQSKDGLFTAALSSTLDRLEAAFDDPRSPVEHTRSLLTSIAAGLKSVPGLVGVMADSRANAEFPAQARDLIGAWTSSLQGRIAASLREGQRRGHFRDDLDTDEAALAGLSMAIGSAVAVSMPESGDFVGKLMVDYCAWR